MARTFGGLITYGAPGVSALSGGVAVTTQSILTRNAAGDISWNQIASQTVIYATTIADLKRPYFTFPAFPGQGTVLVTNEFQEAYGASGVAGAPGPGNPFSGGTNLSFSETPGTPWGLSVIDVFAIYSVGTNPLTTATVTLTRQRYAEGVATAQDILLNASAIATAATASATTTHVSKATLAQPLTFEANDNSDLVVEVSLQTPAGGTARLYALGIHCAIEFS